MKTSLNLSERSVKPRKSGITSLLDNGLPVGLFRDTLDNFYQYVDFVKFGWGTALVTPQIEEKIKICQLHDIDFYLGGTLFEKFCYEKKLDEFIDLCLAIDAKYVEVSNGTIDLSNSDKARYIVKLSNQFKVFSEVGYKDNRKSIHLAPSKWIDYIQEDLDAGACKVITESRESGTSGVCRDNGEIRFGLIEDIIEKISPERLIFEAPNKRMQTFFIHKVGPNVNLGNIAPPDIISLETLRHGLRSDTLLKES